MPPIDPTERPPADPTPAEDPGFELVADDPPAPRAARHLPRATPVRMARYVRAWLLLMATAFATVFGIAAWLRPYQPDGAARTMETHRQLGLPPCNMVSLTGKPCPACGMTTSFSLLVHGDVLASLRANWVGTLLALYWLALIPWAVASAARGRLLWVRNGEMMTTVSVCVLLVLMLGRWAVVFFKW